MLGVALNPWAKMLSPFLRKLDAVLSGLLESDLYGQAGDESRDEHARAGHFGYHQAKHRQRDHADLLKRFCHPPSAAREAQQPSPGKAYPSTNKHAVA